MQSKVTKLLKSVPIYTLSLNSCRRHISENPRNLFLPALGLVPFEELLVTGQYWAFISSFLFSIFVFPLDYAGPFSVVPFCLYLVFPYHPYLFLLA